MLKSNVEGLSKGSNKKVEAICDFCGSEVTISYKLYNRSYSKGDKFSCSSQCAYIKRKELLLQDKGVENPSQLESVKEKRKETMLDRYGVEHYFQSESSREKSKKTNLEKYGVEHATQSDEIKEKIKQSNLEKYGVEWTLQSKEVKEKSKKTCLEKYGVEQASESDEVKEKIKKTNLERFGYVSPMMSDEVKEKSKQTLLKNYGVDNPMKSDKIRRSIKQTNINRYGFEYPIQNQSIKDNRKKNNIGRWGYSNNTQNEEFRKGMIIGSDKNYLKYLGEKISLFSCEKGHEFKIHTDNFFSRKKQNIPLCTICHPINDARSIKENELYDFIKSIYTGEIIQSYRDGLEIDIYLPDLNMGFEFNGLYWHSSEQKSKNYHIDKTEHFKVKGIRIIHIWEDDWTHKQEIVKSMIRNLLNKTENRIYARKCQVKEINDTKQIRKFIDLNHIQGFVSSKIKLGLYFNDELVSIMLFDKNEGRKKMKGDEWNLSRFCSKLNTSVIGGSSKLLSFFIEKYNVKRIISYADKDWSLGDLYFNLGFSMVYETKPDYKYIFNDRRVHKSRFRKSYTGISESQLDITKIYDCGKIKFELIT